MKNEELRQVPRFPLPKEKMKFVFENGVKVFAVRDISQRGLGISLLEFGESLLFPVGHRCEAELKLEGEPFPVHLKVTRANAWSVGFEFEGLKPEQQDWVREFVDPIHIGSSLKAVNRRTAPEAFAQNLSEWYHGDSGTDLFVWKDARGGLERALFCLGERFWEWSDEDGVATGTVEHGEGEKTLFHKHSTPETRTRTKVRKVLEHAQVLDYRLVSFLKEKT